MHPIANQYQLELEKTHIILLPSKMVWWPEEQTLFMADSHFGKASTFRRAGLAVPVGTTSKMLKQLSTQVECCARVPLSFSATCCTPTSALR